MGWPSTRVRVTSRKVAKSPEGLPVATNEFPRSRVFAKVAEVLGCFRTAHRRLQSNITDQRKL